MSEPAAEAGAFTFTAPLWRWQARPAAEPGAWCFVALPAEASQARRSPRRELTDGHTRGFGSVRVGEGVEVDDELTLRVTLRDPG